MITASEIIKKYISFFEEKGHKRISSAPLVPENDPTTLFISAGMHPLVPYLLGQTHPLGKRLVSVQKCLRTDDIDEVGDKVHHTFFEMLGNWSLGDYWKREAIEWSFEFLTSKKWLGIEKNKLAISVFKGDDDAPFDEESYQIWLKLGVPKERVARLPKEKNWWGPPGQTGPCGPDTEMFVWVGKEKAPPNFDPNDPNWVEIWNDVFMQYYKNSEGKFELLKQKNVDTGMGLERILAVLNGLDDDYQTELYLPIVKKIEEISGKRYEGDEKAFRIIADHVRAATFLAAEDVPVASDDKHGSILRKLIDRVFEESRRLGIYDKFLPQLSLVIISNYKNRYSILDKKSSEILNTLSLIESRVEKIMATHSREAPPEEIGNLPKMSDQEILIKMGKSYQKLFGGQVEKYIQKNQYVSLPSVYAGSLAFDAKTTEGYPVSFVEEEARNVLSGKFNANEFYKGFHDYLGQHKKISRKAGEKLFKGGLADNSEITVKYHTATHLLHTALRQILGKHVEQKGSNITSERLRFDFSHPNKLTDEEIKKVEDLVNEKIQENLKVTKEVIDKEIALKSGALGFFAEKYGDKVTVYLIDNFSREICGGPHVDFTGTLKRFKIMRQENIGHGQRRIYAVLEN